MHDELYMLWLSSFVTQLGSRKLNELLAHFGTAKEIFTVPPDELRRTRILSPLALSIVTRHRDFGRMEAMLTKLEAQSIAYISRHHEKFPLLLSAIADPPVGIFYIGELPADNLHKVSIIGSRRCSEYGRMTAARLAKPLAQRDIVIVSGMARGVDQAAHQGAINGGGTTVAVLGCGVDICYPAEARPLRDKIIQNGCVLSEYPPATEPQKHHFPARNRIISGLAHALVVVEAARKSGTLITVDTALDQGREVLAVPGYITAKLCEGTNRLIRDGARAVIDYTDILFSLGITTEAEPPPPLAQDVILAPDEKLVYDAVSSEAVGLDKLLEKCRLPVGNVHLACISLEMKQLIKKLPGARYVRTL